MKNPFNLLPALFRCFPVIIGGLIFSAPLFADDYLISTPNTSLLLEGNKEKRLHFQYYGTKVESAGEIYDSGLALWQQAYPAFGIECTNEVAIQATHADGNMSLDLLLEKVETTKEADAEIWKFVLYDPVYPFNVTICFKAFSKVDIIETWTEIIHREKKPVTLFRFSSAYIPFRPGINTLSHLHGTWTAEAFLSEEELLPGIKIIKNKDGVRNGQNDNPCLMLSQGKHSDENHGAVFGAVLAWSGNYELKLDTDQGKRTGLFAGMNPDASQYLLMPHELFRTPEVAFTFSMEGKGGISRNFHRWARDYKLYHGNKQKDILLNSWEGVYLDVNQQVMEQMMTDFSGLGGELFVMDDGWFGNKYARKTDSSGLGDWEVDREKLPNGIDTLITYARSKGLKFGIWIEPEMINSKSELYEKHPDWIICQSNRSPRMTRGGTQMVLDLSNPKVQDFVFGVVDNLMTKYPGIAYIKWDANMSLHNYGSSYLPENKQSHLYIEYHRGLESVLKRIRAKYPDVVMQACGGGGGKVNYGLLSYFDEFWTSDNTDALQRISIQWGYSHFYPANAMAAHVSAAKNHTTGRVTPLKFRFDVAMSGRLGMELQPKDMTPEELQFSKTAIEACKQIRPVVQSGDLYRLISPYDKDGVASLMYVSQDKKDAVFFAYKIEHFRNQLIPKFRMSGLDPDKKYRLQEINGLNDDFRQQNKIITGRLLMEQGIDLSLDKEYASVVIRLTEE
jgi:alpha-galactosidase